MPFLIHIMHMLIYRLEYDIGCYQIIQIRNSLTCQTVYHQQIITNNQIDLVWDINEDNVYVCSFVKKGLMSFFRVRVGLFYTWFKYIHF
jgi:hypothetical protein